MEFCEEIGVENIREYESRQLKVAQEESNVRLRFETQIARLTHQFVHISEYMYCSLTLTHSRSQFEEQQLQTLQERLAALDKAMATEEKAVKKLEAEKQAIEEELGEGEEIISQYQEELKEENEVLAERTSELEAVKKNTSKASKVLDQTLKDIASKVAGRLHALRSVAHCVS